MYQKIMSTKRQHSKSAITPMKTNLAISDVSSRELKTPNKPEQPGIPRMVFTHASTLQGLFSNWQRLRARGTTLCRSILAIGTYDFPEGEYPEKLGPLVDSLVEATKGLENIVESIAVIANHLQAIKQLHRSEEPVINTWSAKEIAQTVDEINDEYRKEMKLKKYVMENIAHVRDEKVCEVMATTWELEAHVDPEKERFLLADLGVAFESS